MTKEELCRLGDLSKSEVSDLPSGPAWIAWARARSELLREAISRRKWHGGKLPAVARVALEKWGRYIDSVERDLTAHCYLVTHFCGGVPGTPAWKEYSRTGPMLPATASQLRQHSVSYSRIDDTALPPGSYDLRALWTHYRGRPVPPAPIYRAHVAA